MQLQRTGVVYAALGDSMSIDDYAGGPGRGAASLLLRNRGDDFPAWQGRDLSAQAQIPPRWFGPAAWRRRSTPRRCRTVSRSTTICSCSPATGRGRSSSRA